MKTIFNLSKTLLKTTVLLSWSFPLMVLTLQACFSSSTKHDPSQPILSSSNQETLNSSSSQNSSQLSSQPSSSNSGYLLDDFSQVKSWYFFEDNGDGGLSKIQNTSGTNPGKMSVSYQLDIGTLPYKPYSGFGINLTDLANVDPGKFIGIRYSYLGDSHQIRLETSDIKDYDVHLSRVPASGEWRTASIYFDDLSQEGWGKNKAFIASNIEKFSWKISAASGTTGALMIDDVFLMDSSEFVPGDPDLEIKSALIPDSIKISKLTIPNPLQVQAINELNQGINLTNWLEENKKFEKFEYNKSHIQSLSQKGFKAIRLPIDLDQYVIDKSAFLNGTTPFKVDTLLFDILDSFALWTNQNQMSLTIDYHEYDGGLNATTIQDSIYVLMMKSLWAEVSEHFKNHKESGLYFELYNEPIDQITSAIWGALASELIDTIRVHNTTHSLIFGEVNWYKIKPLVARKPFSDPKIIYVFHFYDPFLYTHQGAEWVQMESVKNIPYPYSEDKWNTYLRYFGMGPKTPSWHKGLLDVYYREANPSHLRNLIVEAKQWAVDNNVPVICNEFGANTMRSTHESRINWFRDVINIFEELEIPWTHWGYDRSNAIVDPETGELLPGISEVFHLTK